MDERYNYDTENEVRCIVCNSTDSEQIGAHVFRCRRCGAMWCESCND